MKFMRMIYWGFGGNFKYDYDEDDENNDEEDDDMLGFWWKLSR